ncbi:MAG: site-specific DNA-methyltransferase [Symbiobacteriaceae bacterium]|nr:site-specific DNA-methyltransferase [Symbiobacteriaceae bacterium]
MEVNKIINGDCLEILKTLPNGSIDLIFADPPYWMRVDGALLRVEGTVYSGTDDEWDRSFVSQGDYELFTSQWLQECKRVLKKDGSFWVIGGMQCIYTIGGIMQNLGFWLINDVIWQKRNPTPNFHGTRLTNSHETLIWATTSPEANFTFNYKTAKELNLDTVDADDFARGIRKQLGTVWRIGVCRGSERLSAEDGTKLHSTQKPEELLRRIITISSRVGDLVLDPFAGTMTTGVVAKRTGRRYLMIEQDERYCHYGTQRLEATEESIGDVENAVFDRKPLRVAFKDMLLAGIFTVGEAFYLKGGESAILCEDSRLEYQGARLDIHTAAALLSGSKAQRLNGFDYWYVCRAGQLVSIAVLREEYRRQLEKAQEQ